MDLQGKTLGQYVNAQLSEIITLLQDEGYKGDNPREPENNVWLKALGKVSEAQLFVMQNFTDIYPAD